MYEYKCMVVKVVDGDTVDVDIDLGFGVWMRNQRIRMYGIDAPESRTSNSTEKMYGIAAKKFLIGMLDDKELILKLTKMQRESMVEYLVKSGELQILQTNLSMPIW